MTGILYLLPNLLDEERSHELDLPKSVDEAVRSLNGLIVESEKGGRRFLRRFLTHDAMAAMPLKLLNEHTPSSELLSLIDPIVKGQKWGLVSDAGLPCLADPGAPLVHLAQNRGLQVVSFPGPSSPIIALQLSGLNGQRFAFHGYLAREIDDLKRRLIQLENRSKEEDATQIWIEAPYRSQKMTQIILDVLQPETQLCIALSIHSSHQRIRTQKVRDWKKAPWSIVKEPAVFLLSK